MEVLTRRTLKMMPDEMLIPFLSTVCGNLVISFLLGYVLAPLIQKDPLKVFLWSALFSALAGVAAMLLLPDVEQDEEDYSDPKAKRRKSRKQQAALDEAARKMGMQ